MLSKNARQDAKGDMADYQALTIIERRMFFETGIIEGQGQWSPWIVLIMVKIKFAFDPERGNIKGQGQKQGSQ